MVARIPPPVARDLGVSAGETYESRVRRASYKSPRGTTIEFDFVEVSRSTELRGSAYAFPGVDQHFVQRTGHGSRVYPMRCIFWGPQHDLAATALEAAVLEPGQGTLTHPLHGTFKVTPFGSLARRNDLVEEANTSLVDVTFWTSLPSAYPGATSSPRSEILDAITGFDAAAARQFASTTQLSGVVEQASLRTTIESYLDAVETALEAVASATNEARGAFQDQHSLVQRSLGTLVGQPLLLAQNVVELLKAPARAVANIRARLAAYGDLARSIVDSPKARSTVAPALIGATLSGLSATDRSTAQNDVRAAELFAMGGVAGSALSVVETQFTTRPEAQAAAASVIGQFDQLVAWRDESLDSVGALDDGEAYQALQRTVALVAGYLVEVSFTLIPERIHVTDRPRTIIDLAAELYGEVDSRLDEIIEHNALTGAEILELPAGTAIAYYPES